MKPGWVISAAKIRRTCAALVKASLRGSFGHRLDNDEVCIYGASFLFGMNPEEDSFAIASIHTVLSSANRQAKVDVLLQYRATSGEAMDYGVSHPIFRGYRHDEPADR